MAWKKTEPLLAGQMHRTRWKRSMLTFNVLFCTVMPACSYNDKAMIIYKSICLYKKSPKLSPHPPKVQID